MVDRPILMSAAMVRATLREIEKPGTGKTETRRIINPQPIGPLKEGDPVQGLPGMYFAGDTSWPLGPGWNIVSNAPGPHPDWVKRHVKYTVGERLWVRENLERANYGAIGYPADGTWLPNTPWEWRRDHLPSIHMPRRLSRITLTVTDVRVQRLQEISRDDAIAEGLSLASANIEQFWRWPEPYHEQLWLSPIAAYQFLWDILNTARGFGWEANPWVVAITFRPILANIDSVEALAA